MLTIEIPDRRQWHGSKWETAQVCLQQTCFLYEDLFFTFAGGSDTESIKN